MGHYLGELEGYANDELTENIKVKKIMLPVKSKRGKIKNVTFVFSSKRIYYRATPEETLRYSHKLVSRRFFCKGMTTIALDIAYSSKSSLIIDERRVHWHINKSGSVFSGYFPKIKINPRKKQEIKTSFKDFEERNNMIRIFFSEKIMGEIYQQICESKRAG